MAFADADGARVKLFYHECDDATVRWAFVRLTPGDRGRHRRQRRRSRCRGSGKPSSRGSFITRLDDREQPRWLADVTVLVRPRGRTAHHRRVPHPPFLSRPAELAQLLVDATTTAPVGPLKPNG